jgi:hypothetical protein
MHGAVRFLVPADWKLEVHAEDDHHAQFQSPDEKCRIVVGVQEEEMGFPAQSEQAVEAMKSVVVPGMKKKFEERGVKLLYGPRAEPDENKDFFLRVHTRYVDGDQTYDEMQTYRSRGLDLLQVLTQVQTDDPQVAKHFDTIGDDVALGIILGPADKKKPTTKPSH